MVNYKVIEFINRNRIPVVPCRAGTVGVVEFQNTRLVVNTGTALAGWMIRIPFYLGRPAFIIGDQHSFHGVLESSEEHTSDLQSRGQVVCILPLEYYLSLI